MSKVLQAQGVFPGGPPDEVVSWERSDLYLGSANAPRATLDDLVARKGIGVYERMMADEQVKAVVYFKRDAILARGWSFKFDEETTLGEEEQQQRINLFNRITCAIDGSFADALSGISSGRFFGYSLTEKVYSQLEYDGKTFVGLRKLLTRSPQSFEFYTDEYGVLQRFTQRISGKEQELDIARFVHYVHGPEWDAYYGRSDLREAYRAWYAKQRASDYWLQYLERFAGGLLVASLGPDSALTSKHPDYASLQNALTNARSLSSMILPKGVTLEVTHPSTTDQFERAVTFFDQAIAKALLVPNLLGVSHTGQTGSYAQSQTQLDAFLWTLIADSQRLEACLNEQLFRDLGEQNWGDGEYPEFSFKPMSQEQLRWLVSTWGTLTGQSVVVPTAKDEAHLRELLQMPPRDPEDPTLAEETAQRNQDNGLNPDGTMPQAEAAVVDSEEPNDKALLARIDALEAVLFHSPGGHEHDQKTHAGGSGGTREMRGGGRRGKMTKEGVLYAAQQLGIKKVSVRSIKGGGAGKNMPVLAHYVPGTDEIHVNADVVGLMSESLVIGVLQHENNHRLFNKAGAYKERGATAKFLADNFVALQKENGTTAYSKSFWKGGKVDADMHWLRLTAIDESLAEMKRTGTFKPTYSKLQKLIGGKP